MKPQGIHIVLGCAVLALAPAARAGDPDDASISSSADRYDQVADRIMRATLAGNDSWKKMEELCDGIGHRLSGSESLEKAVAWAAATMKADGQERVRTEKVMVPKWVRGSESATMIKPRRSPISMLGLGGSIGTPTEGITAAVLCVSSKEELDKRADEARGKIVLFNRPMPPYDPETGAGYGATVRYRGNGPTWAAEHGAVACLVRSVTAKSLRTPHTGATHYAEGARKIPAAAISIEDAEMIARLTRRGVEVVVALKMAARTEPDAPSANVIGELRGSELPDEIVVIGGHLDSWDVGQGAHDDGTGCVMAMEAINVLRKLNLRPRRTIRVVLFTNEENGLRGARQYAADHADELANHVAAIESDSGGFAPQGFSVQCSDPKREELAAEELAGLLRPLASIGATKVKTGHSGADIGPMREAGVALLGLNVEGSLYFNYHHTPADTLDKVNPEELSRCVAAMAYMSYVLADMPGRLGAAER